PVGGAVTGRQSSPGGVRRLGDSYYLSADVSQFEPHDVVVMAYNHHVVIHAQKVMDDGSVSDTFTHKSLFPEDMDPLSVSGTLNPDGTLVVSVRRMTTFAGAEPLVVPTYRTEAHL
ncbi:alpha-crystallin B chain-like, partial [Stegastes partitus]